ncbi:phosphorylase family protein [Labrys wisconsinensis]|uniref:Hopanoid-associated phosphorylase n=1 Tax=Labrys wisconsinensis TaxID=425677 RepID=A0ABU0J8G9_9HYPH|nr:phosphorylase [Labrys wisconsinensis]MDQ0470576.1 hopanoid-associated phosphorylase [Labrys wisconsinensis]
MQAAPPSPPRVIALCGMRAEARLAGGPGVLAVCGGGRAELARARLTAALAEGGAAGLVSFGIAGGLDPALAPGTLVLAAWVAGPASRREADSAWLAALAQACPGALVAGVAGRDEAAATAAAKRSLAAASGAAAVDMESHVVAEIAADRGLPFAVIRAVADPAAASLPPAALAGLRPDGRPDIAGVLAALAASPRQLPGLIAAARQAQRALASLGRVRRHLGPGLACPDLLQLVLDVP